MIDKINNHQVGSIAASLEKYLRRLSVDRENLDKEIQRIKQDLATLRNESPLLRKVHSPKGANRKAICNLFEANGELLLGTTEISEKTDMPPSSTANALRQLQKEGVLEKTDKGLWHKKTMAVVE